MAVRASHGRSHPGRALALGLSLTLAFATLEVVVGVLAGSLALISDAGHMLVDSAGLALALAAASVSRRPADLRRTYGYARIEVLVVPVHVALMLGVAGFILVESVRRLADPVEIEALPVLAVGVAGLAVNVVVLRLLHRHREGNMNVRGAWLEVFADTAGSAGVILAAVVVLLGGWSGVDVVVSVLLALFILPRAAGLLRQALSVLLESAPRGIDTAAIEADARSVSGVIALHDLHVWALTPAFVALSAHVEVERMDGCDRAIAALAALLRERHGIDHVTLQPETPALHDAIACCLYPDQGPAAEHEHVRETAGKPAG
jgi:cobalt-zinc-cadmium efflux system protein